MTGRDSAASGKPRGEAFSAAASGTSTVMHEAVVAQLHAQDERLLPGSAVPLQQKEGE